MVGTLRRPATSTRAARASEEVAPARTIRPALRVRAPRPSPAPADARNERILRDRAHLEGQRHRVLWQSFHGADHCGSGKLGSIQVRGERHDENRLQHPRERVALPDHNGPSACLFPWPIAAEICPPDLAALHLRSSDSSASVQASSPARAKSASSSGVAARRCRSHRPGLLRRMTSSRTLSPGWRSRRSWGIRTPSTKRASTVRPRLPAAIGIRYHATRTPAAGCGPVAFDERPRFSGFSESRADSPEIDHAGTRFAPGLELAREHRDHVPPAGRRGSRERVRERRLDRVLIGP